MSDYDGSVDSEGLGTEACIACHFASPDRLEHPHAQLCPECRERYIRYPFPKWLLAALAAIIAVNAACYYLFSQTFKDFVALARAEKYFNEKHYLLASREYASLAKAYPGSESVREHEIDAMMNCGDFGGAVNILNGYYEGKEVPDELYQKLNGYSEVLDKYGRAYEKIEKALEGITGDSAILEKLKPLLDSSDTDPIMLVSMSAINDSLGNSGEALRQLNEAISKGDRYLAVHALLAGILRRQGDYESAEQACLKALDVNADDVEAHRQLAVLHMLNKDWSAALSEAETAYALDCGGQFVRGTLAVACHTAGDNIRRDAVIAEMKQAGEDTGDVESLMAGKTTLEAFYNVRGAGE